MELKDFVSGTINQIIDGVICAQEHAKDVGATVNPDVLIRLDASASMTSDYDYGVNIHLIDFDVAVTATETSEAKGGLGIFIAPITAGAQTKLDYANSVVNRIKFVVPVVLPKQEFKEV